MARLEGLDTLRGIATVLMVIFHFCYDLNHFGYIDINITQDIFWIGFRVIIVTLFLFISGVSLNLANKDFINWNKVKKRSIKLALSALLVTIATYIIFPHAWVYFGILHAIFIFSLVGLFFINRAFLSILFAILILVSYFIFNVNMHPLFKIVALPLHLPLYHTVDLVTFIPWFSIVLIGIATVALNWHKIIFENRILASKSKLNQILKKLGQHSLMIYLIHQPIFFAFFWLFN